MMIPNPNNSPAIADSFKLLLESELGIGKIQVNWLAGDGSDRRYFRILSPNNANLSYVLMLLSEADGKSLKHGKYDWISVAQTLSENSIKVPRVIKIFQDQSALVIEDYGDTMLETKIGTLVNNNLFQDIRDVYRSCFDILANFLKIKPTKSPIPPTWVSRSFDSEKFIWELHFFREKYLVNVANLSLDSRELKLFDEESKRLSSFLSNYSKYFVHRDLHSRNIMCVPGGMAIIDFQDARLGPPSYDLVSLIFDSYVPFNASVRRELLNVCFNVLKREGLEDVISEIESTWRPMLLQRQLKAIGSFGYLTKDKGKGNYLKYVCPALKTLEDQNIADERWPFLSSVVLRKIRDFIKQ